ncbi:paeninodin family lasso peptide [Oceanobacillus piezotolerans]|uniref:Paeninodin family lasso peptide n=1 Tax=Oceanobacillus piezotolerans TaxID=2448030 RepID=A0A498D3L7_9BACI|nr:paeninodin family lasso peptide [Oceanobacillus piezotolerans]RLL42772.1 paeninodin family lasso peptide [Oceanobacillus piezotolerans]
MKKEWRNPELSILNINLTMAGPGIKTPDEVQPDPDAHEHDVVHYS